MARQVSWTELALQDLEDIADWISKDSTHYAAAFVREAWELSQSLSRFGDRGRVVPEFDDPSVRELFVRSYRLIYRMDSKNVYILAFVHGARNLKTLWEKEERKR